MKTVFAFAVAMTTLTSPLASALSETPSFTEIAAPTSKTSAVLSHTNFERQNQVPEYNHMIVNDKATTIAALAPEQKAISFLPTEPKPQYVKGTIVDIDLEQGTALVKPAGKNLINIRLDNQTKVSGKVNSVEELAEGQFIQIRFAEAL